MSVVRSVQELSVSVVGTGRMGTALAGRIAAAGFPLTVFGRDPKRAAAVAHQVGAVTATTLAGAVSGAAVVVVSLSDDAAVREVYSGPSGLAGSVRPGTVVVETTTVAASTVTALAAMVGGQGGFLLDVPVSGSVDAAEQGTLIAMVGGDRSTLATARPVLDCFAAKVFHLGDSGSGAAMKICVNAVLASLNASVSEALVLAERAGLSRAAAYDVFAASAVGAPFVQYKRAAFLDPETAPVAFSVALTGKDVRLARDLAATVGAEVPMVQACAEMLERAVREGWAAADMSAVAQFLRHADPPTG